MSEEEEPLLGISISEIHRYPLRPEGFEEPLFPTVASKRTIINHLSEAPWLMRASELKRGTGEAAHALNEPIQLRSHNNSRMEILRARSSGRCSWRKRRVVEVLDRWREIRGWWDEVGFVDRAVFRLLLAGDTVVEVARERSGGWLLVGVVD